MSFVHIDQIGEVSLERANKVLAVVPGGIWKAVHGALERAGETAKTRAGQFAAAEYTINKGDFMKNVSMKSRITGDSGGAVSMTLSYAGNVLPLLTFNTRFSRGGLLQTQVKRHGVTETLQHVFAERVFGPIAAFERLGTSRFPVEQKYGPSASHMLENEAVIEQMDKTVREAFDKRIEAEINRVLNGWGGKS
ncbi:MAG: hypothetical protein LBK75_08665 [Oscillospiraceae bacterium]|jgi:hypothetical protein|nr:hypothetical protein [Oscillospiraceae bacterium]